MCAERPQGPADRGWPRTAGDLPGQLDRAIRALERIAAALEALAAREPVCLQVERLEVETLAFHLGDIDVEELQGQLSIGITQSLNLEPPGAPADTGDGRPAGAFPVTGAAPGPEPEGGPTPSGQGPAEAAKGPPRALRHSVVSRWLARADVRPPRHAEAHGSGPEGAASPKPVTTPDGQTEAAEPRVQIWPPPGAERSETEDEAQP